MHKAFRTPLVVGLLGLLLLAGCEDPQSFVEPQKFTETVATLRNQSLFGQAQLVYRVVVQSEPQMVHPHIEGRWNFSDNEKPVDVYVFPAAKYNESVPPAQQDSVVFWSSLQKSLVGQQRETSMHLHPYPGEWAIVFFNAGASGSAGRAIFSADTYVTFFK